MSTKFFVSTGEVSGDLHLSYLVKNILQEDSTAKFYGVAGKHCKNEGVKIIQDISELSIMGFVEALKKYRFLKKKARDYVDFIKKERITKVILVDYGGFNLRFLELLKKEAPNVVIYYYIPPKLWIWGEKRIEKLRLADHIIVIFPWEVEFYKKHGVEAIYFGNPFSEKYSLVKKTGSSILLLPGSRKQEIETIFPIMLEVVEKMPDKNFILKLSNKSHLVWVSKKINEFKNLKIEILKSLKENVENSEIAIATSGTVTLELALIGIPTVVVYKTGWLNWIIAKYILKVGYVSLPNLTLNREVFPELLQNQCNSANIIDNINKILNNKVEMEENIEEVRRTLSGKEIIKSYSKYILKGNE
ncbi:MAG: lipid-A-disaccharide synthase [Fusobacteriaceae bacterium]